MAILKLYLITINMICLILMGFDKYFAIKNKKRISEHTFLTLSFFGGCLGTLLGMLLFHHKIRKPKFYFIIPILVILYLILILTKKTPLF